MQNPRPTEDSESGVFVGAQVVYLQRLDPALCVAVPSLYPARGCEWVVRAAGVDTTKQLQLCRAHSGSPLYYGQTMSSTLLACQPRKLLVVRVNLF